jgi:hypothetical protein
LLSDWSSVRIPPAARRECDWRFFRDKENAVLRSEPATDMHELPRKILVNENQRLVSDHDYRLIQERRIKRYGR